MPFTAIIIDDESRARRTLRKLCEKYIPDLEVLADAPDVLSGLAAIREHLPDLVFLDIEMPQLDGFALLEDHVLPDLDVIFTTAHGEHAIRALRAQAQDYLLKPIGISDLEAAMVRFRERRADRGRERRAGRSRRQGADRSRDREEDRSREQGADRSRERQTDQDVAAKESGKENLEAKENEEVDQRDATHRESGTGSRSGKNQARFKNQSSASEEVAPHVSSRNLDPLEGPQKGKTESMPEGFLHDPTPQLGKVALPTEDGLLMVALSEVTHCEGVSSYTVFHLASGRQLIVTRNLKQFEELYAPRGFYRVHHRYLINLEHLLSVKAKDNLLEMTNGTQVPIAHRKKANFLKLLKGLQ